MVRKQNFKSNGHYEPLPERGPSMFDDEEDEEE